MSQTLYTPAKYYRDLKRVKSRIKNYDEYAILDACLNYLHAPAKDEIERLRRHPWLVLLVIKWTFVDNGKIKYARDALDNKNFMGILQATHNLGSLIKMPTEYAHLNLFMRNMAFQQFWYQHSFSMPQYGRQSIIFGSLPDNHTLEIWFKEKHGISCNQFIELSFALIAHFINMESYSVELKWFQPLFKIFGMNTVRNFLNAVSIESNELQRGLTRHNKSKGGYSEYYEQTPFINFPLIKHDQKYICIHPNILYRCVEHFLYDSMKANNSSKFMTYFGEMFENYFLIGLNYAALKYYCENELKKYIPANVKCVDYVIAGDDSNIFIDAKAVEMPYLGKVSDNPDVILGKIKNTAIKAIEQAYDLNNHLLNATKAELPQFKEQSFLLVVTYKELYLGNGEVIYESLAKKRIDEITKTIDQRAVIALSRIYFITIQDFDHLMSLAKNHGFKIEDVINAAILNDSDFKTKKFEFSQHIHTVCNNVKTPEYLENATSAVLEKFKGMA